MPRDGTDGQMIVASVRAQNATRPILDVIPGEIDQLATASEAALRDSGLPIFQRGTSLVVPVSHDVPAAHGRMTIAAGLKELTSPGVIDHLAQAAHFQHWNARSKKMTPTNPPGMVASIILSRSGQWTLPSIAGVITTPTLRPDGSVLTAPGYDAATRLYHVADPELRMPAIKPKPTRADAETALELLKGLLIDFPFVAKNVDGAVGVDCAVALSALITPVLRGIIQVAPITGIRASTAGTGKSFLVDLASAISTARPCPVLAAGEKEEETEKRLVGVLIAAFPIVSIDNCNGELGGDLLCQAIERPLVRVRALGGSEIMEIESRATFYATGNGLRVRGDMTRRTIICSLDANVERPELRSFTQDPLQRVLDNRGAFVAAALTIVRAYLAAGQPDRIKPALASFPDWSNTVRSALIWLGCADPAATMEQAREDDPELSDLRQVIGAWHEQYGDIAKVSGRVAEDAVETDRDDKGEILMKRPALREALMQVAAEGKGISTRRLGKWLSKHEGRIVVIELPSKKKASLRLKKTGSIQGSATWRVESPLLPNGGTP
jgi:putative DNA primase/helicase